jgi:uncharacterized protein (DUF2267 family)
VDHSQFIGLTRRLARLDADAAERAARAALETLAQRLSPGGAQNLREQLPVEMRPWVSGESGREPFDVDEYLRRVAERERVDVATAERHARAVFYALGQVVSVDEIADMAVDLSDDFERLVAEAQRRYVDIVPADAFQAKVAERAGLSADGARRATEAALETLAERIAARDVDDLIRQLPAELHPPLNRGKAQVAAARRMSLEEFLGHVAEREGVPPEEARGHARAVFVTLREVVMSKEFCDVTTQLPNEYWALLATP